MKQSVHFSNPAYSIAFKGYLPLGYDYKPGEKGTMDFPKNCTKGYRFGFNGKEKDNETYGEGNAYDFGARIHDPRVGRFLSVDPDYQKYPAQSAYCFAANSPVAFIDIEGRGFFERVGYFFNKTKNFITKGTFQTNYEIQKEAYQNALHARYDYYNMIVEADPTKADNNYLLLIPFLVDKYDVANPDKPELRETPADDVFESFESKIKYSPDDTKSKALDKVFYNTAYGFINSPWVLATGETLGGEEQTSNGKMDAFIDVLPTKVIAKVATAARVATKVGKYSEYAKKTKNWFKGTSEEIFNQRNKSFKINEEIGKGADAAENADKVRGVGTEAKKSNDSKK